jgi:hypothetical protein
VQRALSNLDAAEQKRRTVDPAAALDALLEGQRTAQRIDRAAAARPAPPPVDLVREALSMLLRTS